MNAPSFNIFAETKPSQMNMVWRVLKSGQAIRVQYIVTITGCKSASISSLMQRLRRGGLVAKIGETRECFWRIVPEYRDSPTPMIRSVNGQKVAVIDHV